ncbi:MAG: outer membrane lipoprotein carrier protein LolA [Sphingomonas sp.]|jgi:outer membrane lipoprotein-sorting protein|nr:outer membrane lipoprotein carrier protein LolA [Sphingomonas sp.]
MSFATNFARALAPMAVIAAPTGVLAAPSGELAKVEAHLNSVSSMTGNFVQVDGKGRTLRGTLQLKRPGRIRFEYGGGANMLLVADGSRLTFIDYDVGQKSGWDVNKTPLGLLLAAKPNVKRIASIVPDNDPRVVVVRARDPSRAHYGSLILAFIHSNSAPGGLQLYGWTAIDPQNKKTKVTLTNVRYNVGVPETAFAYAEPKKRGR